MEGRAARRAKCGEAPKREEVARGKERAAVRANTIVKKRCDVCESETEREETSRGRDKLEGVLQVYFNASRRLPGRALSLVGTWGSSSMC